MFEQASGIFSASSTWIAIGVAVVLVLFLAQLFRPKRPLVLGGGGPARRGER